MKLKMKNNDRKSLSTPIKSTLKKIDRFINECITIFINQLEIEKRERTKERG